MRRILTLLLLTAIVGGIAWWLVRWDKHTHTSGDPWNALPTNAAVIVSIPDPLTTWERFTGTAQLWSAMERMPGCQALHALLLRVGAAAASDPELMRTVSKAPLLLAMPSGTEGGMTIIWSLPADAEVLAALGPAFKLEGDPQLWKGGIATFEPDTALGRLSATWRDGLLLMATSEGLLKESLARLDGPITTDSLLMQARSTLGIGADAHVLVQPGRASRLIERWLDPSTFSQFTVPEGWAGLDVRLRADVVLLSGLLFTPAPTKALAAMERQENMRSTLGRVLPARTNWLRSVSISDPALYLEQTVGAPDSAELFTAYASWIHGPVGQAMAFTLGDSMPAHWAVLRTEDPSAAARALTARCPNGRCDTTAYRGIRIDRVADSGALEAVLGKDFSAFPKPLWAILGDKVVFTEHPAWMREVIDAWTDGNSLALDPRSGRFFQRFSSDAGITWWADGARSFAPLRTMARPATVEGMDRWFKVWQALGGCLLEVSNDRPGIFQIALSLQHAPIGQQEADALWSASVGSSAAGRPWLLKDHLSRTMLILTQDKEHRISLVSCTGKVLWQRELDGPILGEVHQVDRFKNGKLQMLFNTAGRVHLIDRNGKDVEGFPIVTPAPCSAPISVFDYESTREYRVMVPTTDGQLLNFDANGKPVQGWATTTGSPLLAPVEHLRVEGKDILVAARSNGMITVLDRRGTPRYDPGLHLNGITRFFGIRAGSDIPSCVALWADSTGAVLSGTLDGKVDTISMASGGHTLILGRGSDADLLVARGRRDSVFVDDRKGPRFRSFLPEDTDGALFVVEVPGVGEQLGAVSPEREQIRLYRSDGSLWPGFPLKGAAAFRVADINLDGVLELVTTTRDGNVLTYPLEGSKE
ncbi:MAG TPA: hypothetical protein VGE21_11700 [Flavobacteriales bacterium]